MFKHPFKVKTNTNVRNSDRKKLIAKMGDTSTETLGKAPFSVANIILGSGAAANVYICDKQPIVFEPRQNELYPSVYLTWKLPRVFPTLFIPEPVLAYLLNGADLMLPGVLLGQNLPFFNFQKGDAVCVSVYFPKKDLVQGPVAVGTALMSSEEMIKSGMKGKGLSILHVIQDELWNFGSREATPIYELSSLTAVEESKQADESEKVDGAAEDVENLDINKEGNAEFEELPPESESEPIAVESAESHEEFLRKVFLFALKYRITEEQKYPLDVGQFYATVILKSLPEGRKIEIKKTKYKKFSNFLQEINETADNDWFVKVVSTKGVDSITAFNLDHPDVQNAEKLEGAASAEAKPGKVKIADCFTLTDSSLSMIKMLNPTTPHRRGDLLHPNDASELIKDYVKNKNLSKPGNKALLDDTLQSIVKKFTAEIVPINEIVQQLTSKMTKAFLITTPDGRRILRKTQIPQIVLKTEKRAGNKHVTLVNNLSPFGIEAKEFAQKVQHGISTGATVNQEAQCCTGPQVLVLGNQVNFIVELLSETYGLQKKYINGAELGVKTKKGKK